MQEIAQVFISATTPDLGSYRLAVRDVLLTRGVQPRLQDHLPSDYQPLMDILRREINACDAVICLVGFVYGQEPKARPAEARRRSYTQLEFDLAAAFDKPIYVFLATEQCLFDAQPDEPLELCQLQQQHRQQLRQRPHKRESFSDLSTLRERIAAMPLPAPVAGSGKPDNLPYLSLGTRFKGRDTFVTDLHQRLSSQPGSVAAIVARQAIHGLGGVGKTRLAVEYAWRYQADYTALLFVPAGAATDLQRNVAALCAPLGLPERQAREEEVQRAAVLRCLEAHYGWLLILDNVDSPEAAQAVEALLPRLQHGHVLLTSCLSLWGAGVESLPLDVLAEPDAVAFVLERTAGCRHATLSDEADALALAQELGSLALALEQAGAYIQHVRCSLGEYHRRWRGGEARVRTWFDARLMQYPRSLAITWETTLAQLDAPARALLHLLAWLAPEPVPRVVFHGAEVGQMFAAALAGPAGETPAGEVSLEEALAALAQYSMVTWTDSTNASVQVHRLVQEITRGQIVEAEQGFWLEHALHWLDAVLSGDPPPQDVRSWSRWEPLRPHVAVVIARADQAGIHEPTARLMNELGLFLATKGTFIEAEPLHRRALAIAEADYGPQHPTVATGLNNLANLLKATNRLAEAEPLFRRALAITEAAYGPQHPDVARDLNNLALLLQATNRLAEAEPLSHRAVSILQYFQEATGHEHPHWQAALANYQSLLHALDVSAPDIKRLPGDTGPQTSHRASPPAASPLLPRLWHALRRWRPQRNHRAPD